MMNFLTIFLLASLATPATIHHIIITPDAQGYRVVEVIAIQNATGEISIQVPENAVLMSNGTLKDGVLRINASENVTKVVYGYTTGKSFMKTFQLPAKLVYFLLDPSIYVVSEGLNDAGIQNVFGSDFRVLYAENVTKGYTVNLEMSRVSTYMSAPQDAQSSGNKYIFAGLLGAVALSAIYLKKIRSKDDESDEVGDNEGKGGKGGKKESKWEVE